MDVIYKRTDGTFVAIVNGMPYHVTHDDPLFPAAQQAGEDAPFEPEPEKPAETRRRVGTPREFLGLFSPHEKALFFAAARDNVELQIWWAEASTGSFSLDHPSVEEGLTVLVSQGILSEDRKSAILQADFNKETA